MEQADLGVGIQKLILREAAAGSAPATPGATVRLRYAVSAAEDLEALGEEAAATVDAAHQQARLMDEWVRQPPHVFSVVLSQGDALPCVETAVLSMAEGEVARFLLSGSAARDLQQMAPMLATAKSLTLTIELLAITPAPKLDLATATAHKDAGNAAFKEKRYGLAIEEYMHAIDVVDRLQLRSSLGSGTADQERDEAKALATVQLDAHNNISLCNIHTSSFATALHHCNIVLASDSANPKALNRRARAYKGLHDYSSARHDCEAILRLAENGIGAVTSRMTKDASALLLVSSAPSVISTPRGFRLEVANMEFVCQFQSSSCWSPVR